MMQQEHRRGRSDASKNEITLGNHRQFFKMPSGHLRCTKGLRMMSE